MLRRPDERPNRSDRAVFCDRNRVVENERRVTGSVVHRNDRDRQYDGD